MDGSLVATARLTQNSCLSTETIFVTIVRPWDLFFFLVLIFASISDMVGGSVSDDHQMFAGLLTF